MIFDFFFSFFLSNVSIAFLLRFLILPVFHRLVPLQPVFTLTHRNLSILQSRLPNSQTRSRKMEPWKWCLTRLCWEGKSRDREAACISILSNKTCGSIVDEADPSVDFLMCHFLHYFGALLMFYFFLEKHICHTLLLFFILHFFYLNFKRNIMECS